MALFGRNRGEAPEGEVISMQDVIKSYSSGAPALNGIDLHIKRGEFVFVVGDSGSGKSTLIKLLLKELTPTSGKIHVLGQDLVKMRHGRIPRFLLSAVSSPPPLGKSPGFPGKKLPFPPRKILQFPFFPAILGFIVSGTLCDKPE